MKQFIDPTAKVIYFDADDLVSTSGSSPDDFFDGVQTPDYDFG